MRTMMLAGALALTLGIVGGANMRAEDEAAASPSVPPSTYQRADGDWAQLTPRQTGNVELAYVTTTQGESTQTWNQNEGVGG